MTASTIEPSVAVVGIGNLLLADEGLGVDAVRELAGSAASAGVKFIDGGTDPWAAFREAEGCRALLVLDAVQGGKAPGDFHSLPLEEVETRGAIMSLHGVTMYHLLHFEALLGNTFEEVRVLGMEPGRVRPEIGLSEPCKDRMQEFAALAAGEIDGMLKRLSAS